MLGSLGVAVLLLIATWVVALLSVPGPADLRPHRHGASWGDFGFILYRNGLVLALHAMACVAGFMAGSSLPVVAEGHRGWWRAVHDHAGRLAMAFVAAATLFSLTTQAYALGLRRPSLADAQRRLARACCSSSLLAARGARAVRAVPPAGRLAARRAGVRPGTSCWPRRSSRRRSRYPCSWPPRRSRCGSRPHVLYFLK